MGEDGEAGERGTVLAFPGKAAVTVNEPLPSVAVVPATGPDGAIVITPPTTGDPEAWREVVLARTLQVQNSAASMRALQEGLTAGDLTERRRWWELMLKHVTAPGGAAAADGGARIQIVNNVPGPSTPEEGALPRARDVSPGR